MEDWKERLAAAGTLESIRILDARMSFHCGDADKRKRGQAPDRFHDLRTRFRESVRKASEFKISFQKTGYDDWSAGVALAQSVPTGAKIHHDRFHGTATAFCFFTEEGRTRIHKCAALWASRLQDLEHQIVVQGVMGE